MDLNLLTDEEFSQVKTQIAFMKKYRDLIQIDGDFYRLVNPFEGNDTAWMVVSQDKKEAVAAFYQRMNKVNASWLRLKMEGLESHTLYEITYVSGLANEEPVPVGRYFGDELMYAGMVIDRDELNRKGGDFSSVLYTLQAVE